VPLRPAGAVPQGGRDFYAHRCGASKLAGRGICLLYLLPTARRTTQSVGANRAPVRGCDAGAWDPEDPFLAVYKVEHWEVAPLLWCSVPGWAMGDLTPFLPFL